MADFAAVGNYTPEPTRLTLKWGDLARRCPYDMCQSAGSQAGLHSTQETREHPLRGTAIPPHPKKFVRD